MQPFPAFDFSSLGQFFGPFDFLFSGGFWAMFYFVLKWIGITLIAVFSGVSLYSLFQVWPLRMHLRVREGFRAHQAPHERYALEDTQKISTRKKWAEIVKRAQTQGAAGFSLALIEADVLLENTLGRIGIAGKNIAERLKSLAPDELSDIAAVWDAHAIRNRIAHEPGFAPTRADVTRSLAAYKKALEDLEAI